MKRILSFFLVIIILFCAFSTVAASTAGTASDPLVSLSYITDTFIPGVLLEAGNSVSSKLNAAYAFAEADLNNVYNNLTLLTGGPSGYTLSDSFLGVTLDSGETVSLLTGGMFILTSGKAALSVTRGAVINISTGTEVSSGSQLVLNQRYFCAEDAEAVFTASSVSVCLVDGYYKTSGTLVPDTTFFDVPAGSWFYDAVNYCVNIGLFEGMGNGAFSPATNMNMAQLLQILYRMAGYSTGSSSPYWYSAAQKWAIGAGLITEAEFSPSSYVTREYFISMFYACAAYVGGYDMTPRADLSVAVDYNKISSEYLDEISWAVATGIIVGTSGESLTIDPDANVNRATVCQMIMRYFKGL